MLGKNWKVASVELSKKRLEGQSQILLHSKGHNVTCLWVISQLFPDDFGGSREVLVSWCYLSIQ